jgi:hypothetical protein
LVIENAASILVGIEHPGLANPVRKCNAEKRFIVDIVKAIVAFRRDYICSFLVTRHQTP